MKNNKMLLLVLLIAVISLCFAGCGDRNAGTKRGHTIYIDWYPVFETDNISGITFFHRATDAAPAEVPDEYMREITQWLGSFLPDEEIDAHSVAAPGADSYSVRIEYADGTVAEGSLDTCTINGTRYRLTSAPTPACWFAIWETAPENRK